MVSRNPMKIDVEITYMRKINWSLLRAGVPLVWMLKLSNRGSAPAIDLMVRISLPNYLDTGFVPLSDIAPGTTYEIQPQDLPWIHRDFEAAMRLTNRVDTDLQIELGGQKADCPICILSPDEWCPGVSWKEGRFVLESIVELGDGSFELPPGGTVNPKKAKKPWRGSPPLGAAAAALVLPEHPRVADIKKQAIALLAAITGKPRVSLDECVSGTCQQKTNVVQAVFAALAELYPKAYHDIEKFSLETRSQRIRFPDEVVSEDAARRQGATCVDYALLLCGVLEACGLAPLFILIGTSKGICHALVGCCLSRPGQILLTDIKDLQQYVKSRDILVVDVTEFSKGKNFQRACKLGKACLNLPNHFCYALDTMAARRDYGIDPLPWPAPPAPKPENDLAKQMRAWFEALGYRFERHTVRSEDYFEWIINVPARRGYDRILVRGIEGEAKKGHVVALRQGVDKERTDEGWLVAVRRISQPARLEVEKKKNRDLFCYTFDELLDEQADFSRYFKWLEEEVKRQNIDSMYVPLACNKEEFDVVTKKKVGESRYAEREGWIDGYIDVWLDDPAKEHISILGEFGTGKTWFALHYAWITLRRYRRAKERGVERPRLPLFIPLRDYAKAVSAESLFSEFFFRKHEISLPGYSAFDRLNRMGKLLLIFDGFDEMAARVDRQKMINNFWELARVVVQGSKAILTCRSAHFPEAREGRSLLSGELQASTASLTGEPPQFEMLELEKLDDAQIRQVLSVRTEPAKLEQVLEQVMGNPKLLDLARRPFMIELILEARKDIEDGKPVDMSRIFLYAVRRKMERDIKEERTFTSLADKLYFMCELSWEMLSNDRMSLNYRLFPDRLRRLFGEVVREQKDLDHWHFDMLGQAMLIRNDEGDYFPAHRSFLEFFVAIKFVAEMGVLAPDFIQLAQAQSHIDKNGTPKNYVWSEYFRRDIQEGKGKLIAPLRAFATEDIDEIHKKKDIVRVEKLTPNVLPLAAGMVSNDPICLNHLCEIAWDKTGALAWNANSLLPFLKHQHSEELAGILVKRSEGRPLRSGVAWVLGELGVGSKEVVDALRETVKNFARGSGASPSAWWESAFALEKLGDFGPRKGRQGNNAIAFLIENLPPTYTLQTACEHLLHALRSSDPQEATVNQADIVTIVQHESKISCDLFPQILELVDFQADTKGRRCYFVAWLCGHLGIRESLEGILKASKHRLGSVRNCASEALGKIGIVTPAVIRSLEDALTDSYYRTRFHAAWSLGELDSSESIPTLSAAIKDEEFKDVREEMIRVRDSLSKPPIQLETGNEI